MSKGSQQSNNATGGCLLVVLAAVIIYVIVKWIGDHIQAIALVVGIGLVVWLGGIGLNKWLERRAFNRGSESPSKAIGYLISLAIVAALFIIYFIVIWIIGHILIGTLIIGIPIVLFLIGFGVKKWLERRAYLNALREKEKTQKLEQQEREIRELEYQKRIIIEMIEDEINRN